MAGENPIYQASYQTGADLSADSNIGKFVKLSSGKVILCAALTDKPEGVLLAVQGAAGTGQTATVGRLGRYQVNVSGALTQGTVIGTDANGQAVACVAGTDTTHYAVGAIFQASNGINELVIADINCLVPHRAA